VRILIVGGTGFIGPYVAKELHGRGHDVTLFHRGQHESAWLIRIRQVCGFYVAMDDFLPMRGIQRVGHFHADLEDLLQS